jgi:tetratricopeptide (TPR) repeat protein
VLTAKKKLAVRKAVPESSFSLNMGKAQDFYEDYKKIIIWGGLALVAVVVFSYIYISGKKSDEVLANSQLNQVLPLMQQGQYKLAIDGDPSRKVPALKDIASKFSGTNSGELAATYVGQCYLNLSDFDNAITAFNAASPSGSYLKSLVKNGLAAAYEGKKEFAKAAELYTEAAGMVEDEYLKANRFFNSGRAYCLAGSKDKAVEAFKMVKNTTITQFEAPMTRLIAQYNLPEIEK